MTAPVHFTSVGKTLSVCSKIAIGLCLLLVVPPLNAAVLLEDAITNASPASNLGSTAPWSGSSSQIKVATGNLSYASLRSITNSGNLANIFGTSGGTSYRAINASPITSGSVYFSFLIQAVGAPGSSGYLTGLLPGTSPGGSADALAVYFSAAGNGYQLGIHKGSGPATTNAATVLATNLTQFIVVKYSFGPGSGDDTVSLYVNPTPGLSEPLPDASQAGGTDAAGLQYLYFKSSGGYGAWYFDTLRVGTTWTEVTPADDSSVPAAAPVITQALLGPEGLILRGTNGIPDGVYQVLASSNLTISVANWPSIAAHTFDVSGNFDSTNPVASGQTQQFFRLLVGGTIPPPPTGPVITNQPQSLTVAVGANTNLTADASGSAPLAYFWSRNTNTPVGGNSSTLDLINVQTNDAGSYRVIVSNSVGTATSSVATVTVLIPPGITADPTNLTVVAGSSSAFHVNATGSAPLTYQWYFNNTDTPLADETNATLTLNSVNAADAGGYFAIVANPVGDATSLPAKLTVLGPPVIESQPESQSGTVSNSVTFTVAAAGTAPLAYKWLFNTNATVGVNSNKLVLLNLQTTNAGVYSVIITNDYGAVTSTFATLTVNPSVVADAKFNLTGFGQATIGGGVIPETDAAYVKVTNAMDLAVAIRSANKTAGSVKVIEIMNDLDLGWIEVGPTVQALTSNPFRSHATPKLHPRLIATGVSLIDIKSKSGLTIFSANGATIRHATFNIKGTANIIVRNLKFDEMWEWDESSKGNYDGNDWDFIDLGNGGTVSNIWIDHCTFTKAYDGITDIKGGSFNITFSWCRYTGDDGATNPNSFVWQQINSLESNKTAYAMYNSLRTTSGFTPAEIVTIIQGHDKTHLVGANDGVNNANNAAENAQHAITFHHQWFQNCWDRCVPRLRAGNVHNYNIYVDDTQALAAKRLRDLHTISSSYSFNPFLNGSISTENGAILVEKSIYKDCITPLRNNQTDTNNPAYTGKIQALDTIYQFDATVVRGNSTDPGNPLGPFQATPIPFSWNLPGGVLPYSYQVDDPSNLESIVTSPTTGAGSGVLNWAKTNWLKTTY